MSALTVLPSLEGKKVLVTGGSAGIGKATALSFAASGATVVIAARRKDRLDAVIAEAATTPSSTMHGVLLDLSSEESCRNCVQQAVTILGGLDVVVNCGGVVPEQNADSTEVYAAWKDMLNLHVTSAFVIVEAAKEELIKSKGCVVNVSSVNAAMAVTLPLFINYACAKAAQNALTRSQALSLAEHGVRVNGVMPAVTWSDFIEEAGSGLGRTPEQHRRIMGSIHPLGRVAEVQEVAGPILFLCSPMASFVTGVIMEIDGGLLLTNSFNQNDIWAPNSS